LWRLNMAPISAPATSQIGTPRKASVAQSMTGTLGACERSFKPGQTAQRRSAVSVHDVEIGRAF